MSVDISHLVLVPSGHADDEVVDERADGTERGHVLARTVVHFDGDDILLGMRKRHGDVTQILAQFASRPFDRHDACFDVDFDCDYPKIPVSVSGFSFSPSEDPFEVRDFEVKAYRYCSEGHRKDMEFYIPPSGISSVSCE